MSMLFQTPRCKVRQWEEKRKKHQTIIVINVYNFNGEIATINALRWIWWDQQNKQPNKSEKQCFEKIPTKISSMTMKTLQFPDSNWKTIKCFFIILKTLQFISRQKSLKGKKWQKLFWKNFKVLKFFFFSSSSLHLFLFTRIVFHLTNGTVSRGLAGALKR